MKFSDLDIDIPSKESSNIKLNLLKSSILNDKGDIQPHPAGVYFYKSIPAFNGLAVLDYKSMEALKYQKIDILNNTFLDDLTQKEFIEYISVIENGGIDWKKLWKYDEPYQLGKYPGILREFKVCSVLDVAMVLAIIRPGSLKNYDKLKMFMHTDKILNKRSNVDKKILEETYGIPVFDEQFKKLGIDDGKYRYKKPHSIGYAFVLLIDFLKKS